MGFTCPRLLQGSSGDAPGGVAQCQRHDHHVVERADDREELGDEVDGREDPEPSEGDGQFGSAGDTGVTAQAPDGDRTRRKESGEVFQQPRWEPPGQQEKDQPGCHHQAGRHRRQAKDRHTRQCNACYNQLVTMKWVLLIVRVPAEPSRHRVAIWRELRRTGAIQLAAAVWAFPARPAFEEALQRVAELAERAEGEIIRLHAIGADDAQAAKLEAAYTAERDAEWAEFLADCDKYLAELDREIAIQKFTRAELEEEEQSMERLRRWHRELALRDIFGAPSGPAADRRLKDCEAKLDDYTERVFNALHAT